MSKIIYYPLSSTFMITGIIGFFVSVWLVSDWSASWSFALAFFFVIMFIASMITMTKAEPITKHMNELAIHEPFRKKKIEKEVVANKQTKFSPKWYDGIFIVFTVVAAYYLFQILTLSAAVTDPSWFLLIMTAYVIITLWLVVDALSAEDISLFMQIIFVMIILLLGPIGMFVYYFYRRTKGRLSN